MVIIKTKLPNKLGHDWYEYLIIIFCFAIYKMVGHTHEQLNLLFGQYFSKYSFQKTASYFPTLEQDF